MKKTSQFCLILLAFASVGCHHKNLYYDLGARAQVQVVYDWRNVRDANNSGMSLYLFSETQNSPESYEFTNPKGGVIVVTSGDYRAISINGDLGSCFVSDSASPETFEICTRDANSQLGIEFAGLPRASGTDGERFAETPTKQWSVRVENLSVASYKENLFYFYPEENICNYTVDILNADNIASVKTLFATLSGLSEGFLPGPAVTASRSVTHSFPLNSDGVSFISGEMLTFGRPYGVRDIHKLTVYAIYSNGEKWYYTYDVTDQVLSAGNPKMVHIILDTLPLPKPSADGGFNPDVAQWQSVDINIEM